MIGQSDPEMDKKAHEDHDTTMEKLYKLLKDNDKAKLIYVPGGTDSAFLYDHDEHDDHKRAVNLHKNTHELAEKLLIAGLGGSVPAIYHSYGGEGDLEGQQLGSYPY